MLRNVFFGSSLIFRLLDWFVPPELQDEPEAHRRARMFLFSHIFGPWLGHTITVYLYNLDPHVDVAYWTIVVSISLFWIFPFALKLGANFTVLALLSVQNLAFITLFGSYQYGGVSSPFLPWLLTAPLLALFYLGQNRKLRYLVLGGLAAELFVYYTVFQLGHAFPNRVPLAALSGVGIISVFCAAVYISMMAVYYANVVASQSELEREVQRHRATAIKLRESKEDADRVTQDAERAKNEAVRANSAKSEFLAKMSHELRTPLNAVIGYSEMLLEDAQLEGRDEPIADLRRINSAGKHLLSLVTDVLDLSKIEAGKMEVLWEPFELETLIGDVVATARPLVEKNSNEFRIERKTELGKIAGDATKLRQAVLNLLSNAGKFTSDGTVTLEIARDAVDGRGWVTIAVRDTGTGISGENLGRLFENFVQADAAVSSKYGGTGLGLALSRKLCRLMGGDIGVTSRVGEGSCFTIRVPASASDAVRPSEIPRRRASDFASFWTPSEGTSVLVIDDDPAVLDLMRRMLSKEGFRPILAEGGAEGMRLARAMKPDTIVLDVLMPTMDGWEVLRQLKADPELQSCPVVMLTMVDDRRTGMALGASEYLLKPIDRDTLLRVLERFRAAGPAAAPPPPGEGRYIDAYAGETVLPALKPAHTALERIRQERPQVILLDLHLPPPQLMDFLDVLRRIPNLPELPLIVLAPSTLSSADAEELDGAATVLSSLDYSPDEILDALRNVSAHDLTTTRLAFELV